MGKRAAKKRAKKNNERTAARKVKRGPSEHRELKLRTRSAPVKDVLNKRTSRTATLETRNIDEQNRTVSVSFSSETAEVRIYSHEIGETSEVLLHTADAVDLAPLVEAGSVLWNHNHDLPVAIPKEVSIDEKTKRGRAVIYFPEGDEEAEKAWRKVKSGLVRGVSVGFEILAYEDIREGASSNGHQGPKRVITKWRVHEFSLTPVPADSTVGVGRSQTEGESTMPFAVRMAIAAGLGKKFGQRLHDKGLSDAEVTIAINAELMKRAARISTREESNEEEKSREDDDEEDREEDEEEDREDDDDEDREDDEDERSRKPKQRKRSGRSTRASRLHERQRCLDIQAACREFNVSETEANAYIEAGTSYEEVCRQIVRSKRQQTPGAMSSGRNSGGQPALPNGSTQDGADKRIRHMTINLERAVGRNLAQPEDSEYSETSVHAEIQSRYGVNLDGKGVERENVSFQRFMREYLIAMGVSHRQAYGMSALEVWTRAFDRDIRNRAAANASADYANALSALQHKALMRGFRMKMPTWRAWCKKGNLKDFKPHPRINLSALSQFRETPENTEIHDSKVDDGVESITLANYSRQVSLTWQMFVNDDIDALGRIPQLIGTKAAQLPSRLVYTHLLSNPTMRDGNSLFDNTNHGNNPSGATTALDDSNKITALKTALQKFHEFKESKAPNDTEFNDEPIEIEPAIILVPAPLDYHARSLADPNLFVIEGGPFKNRFEVLVEPRLGSAFSYTGNSDTAWYLTARATDADIMEVGFLDGQETPFTRTIDDQQTLALSFQAWLPCAAKALDWRGIVKSAGA